jgi:uncharacterized delta-60 repeat protein
VKPSPKAARTFLFATLFPLILAWSGAIPSASAQTILVTSANPSSSAQGTVNLNVTISGRGFKKGAKSHWFVTGTTNPGGVTVNSTAFNNSQQLTANITLAADATIANFDIVVQNTDSGTGKGTELFAVTAKGTSSTSSCPVLTPKLTTVTSCTSTLSGCLDTTFGIGGLVETASDGNHDNEGMVPLIQSDGKVVVAGYGDNPNATTGIHYATVLRYYSDGSLDTIFSSGGIAYTNIISQVQAAALQPDGKIVVAGLGFVAARFKTDGTLDASFGSGGVAVISFSGPGATNAYGLAIQSDGKIVIGGTGNSNPVVVRLNPDGSLDSSFGSGGEVIFKNGGVAAGAVVLQNVTAGTATEQLILVGGGDFALMRLTPSGTLDSTFGPNRNGQVTGGFCGMTDKVFAMARDAGGNIVLAGYSYVDSTLTPKSAVVRFTANGILDTTFGDPISGSSSRTGKTAIDFLGGQNTARGVAGQTDGKIVVSGWIADPNTSISVKTYYGVARLNPDGTLDTTFGTGGVVATNFGNAGDFGHELVIQPDGKIVVTGTTQLTTGSYFSVARYWP